MPYSVGSTLWMSHVVQLFLAGRVQDVIDHCRQILQSHFIPTVNMKRFLKKTQTPKCQPYLNCQNALLVFDSVKCSLPNTLPRKLPNHTSNPWSAKRKAVYVVYENYFPNLIHLFKIFCRSDFLEMTINQQTGRFIGQVRHPITTLRLETMLHQYDSCQCA